METIIFIFLKKCSHLNRVEPTVAPDFLAQQDMQMNQGDYYMEKMLSDYVPLSQSTPEIQSSQ